MWIALAAAMVMSSSTDLNDAMAREGSGTSWLPDATPMHAWMWMPEDAMLMVHGQIMPRFTRVGGDRDVSAAGRGGRARFDAPSMFMAMYAHALGDADQLGLRAMASLDPLIEGSYGYPLLYQTGETYHGTPLHDRQHPHDLIDELSATWSHRFTATQSAYVYVGYPGEPALGPPMFWHRPSGADIPDAPIGHHWQDATHIAFGVGTLGYSLGDVELEASVFTGREPDQTRYNFDPPKLDSYSGRISWNPARELALQISHGYLKGPESLEPDVAVHRTTASLIWVKPLASGAWSTSVVWGRNHTVDEDSDSWLVESDWHQRRHTVFGRVERVEKSAHELALAPDEGPLPVSEGTIGYLFDLFQDAAGTDVGLGAAVTLGSNDSALDAVYGDGIHTGFQVFVRIRPSALQPM
ncbi:MAG TPA: hypothetical protein VFB36_07265 [Nevskiaceae bacterium]|nr:hypothetical protein [Nevskiaceae bacterium]